MTPKHTSRSQSVLETRRDLLKLGACSAMTNTSFLSTLMHLKMTNAVMAGPTLTATGGYKALVCLFFTGAIDSFNVLAPHGTTPDDPKFAQYRATRTGAAQKRNPALGFNNPLYDDDWTGTNYGYLHPILDSASAGGTGRTYGLHPQLVHLKDIYNAGHATFVANTGALVDPIADNSEYILVSKRKPVGLFSHPDQQRHWQTAVPTSRNQVQGWAGKMADLFTDSSTAAAASNVYTAISLAGTSLLLTGSRISPYTISTSGAVQVNGFNSTTTAYDRVFTSMQKDLASQTYADLLERTIRDERSEARDAALAFQTAFSTTALPSEIGGSPVVPFSTTGVGANLGTIAKAIKIAQSPSAPLHQERQIFVVTNGSWDHHANVIVNQYNMLQEIDNALKAFYDFLRAENLLDKVTLFSISDFSRTLQFNGSGTDHAWGGNPLVMGGAVNGEAGNNRIWGNYPDIVLDASPSGIDRGRGVLIPSTSSDVYHAEICRWFGVPDDSNLELVLPNIRNFYSTGSSGGHPVGFMKY